MKGTKKAPTEQVKGHSINTNVSYHTAPTLSMAVQTILLALQAPDDADRLRWAYYDELDQVLRSYYTERRAGA